MKNQFYDFIQKLSIMIIVVGSCSLLAAQNAKIDIISNLTGFYTNKMSTNGRFLTGGAGGADAETIPFVWDMLTGEYVILGSACTAQDVSNDGIVVGNFFDPSILVNGNSVMSAGWWFDGVWHSLGGHPDHPITGLGAGSGSCAAAISADGNWIGGYVFVTTTRLVPCVWKKNEDGDYVFYKDYSVFEGSFQGGRVWDMSDDGQVICGWDSMSTGGSVWKPTIWLDSDVIVRPQEVEEKGNGMMKGINPEGTKAVGSISGFTGGVIVGVDSSFKFLPVSLSAIASNDMVITKEGVWTEQIGVWDLIPWMKKFWNIDVDETRYSTDVVTTISGDGKYIGGCFFDKVGLGRVPFVITLDGFPVALAPDVVNTVLKQVSQQVEVSWEKPFFNGYDVLGYNVYRGTEKLNSFLLTDMEFIDINPQIGANCYSVSAVYRFDNEVESAKSLSSCIEVISEDGCFSPKHLESEIVYNKTVNLSWKMPLPNYGSFKPENGRGGDEIVKIKPLFLKKYQLNTKNEVYPASNGTNIYVMNYNDMFYKYTADGDFVQTIKLGSPFLPNYFGGLACDGEFFYTGSTLEMGGEGTVSFKLDIDNKTIVSSSAKTMVKKRHIAYIPTLDNGNGGFEIGNDTSSYFYKKDLETLIGRGLKNIQDVFATAYYDGKIYITSRIDGDLTIRLFDAITGMVTNEVIDLNDYSNLIFSSTAKLGGLTVFKSTENILCLAVVVIDDPANSLVFLQLEQMEGLLGYNVYRNGAKVNQLTINETVFSEDIIVPGDYTYNVTSLFEGGCESQFSFPVEVTIYPLGECNVPENVEYELIRNNVLLTWDIPLASDNHLLVGYNVYRDGVKLNDKLIKSNFFTDTDLSFDEHAYQVEAFYDNSCVSNKSEPVVVDIRGYNVVSAPTDLFVVVEDSKAALNWEEPAIGDFKIFKWYNGGIEWTVGEEGGGTVYIASKWDADDLATCFDYTLTDIEFYPELDIPHTFYVYVDDVVVREQYVQSVNAGSFNLLKLDSPVLIEKGKSLMVGYKVTNSVNEYPIGADKTLNKSGKGDLISYDGVKWESLYNDYGVITNWAISIRLMPYSIENTKFDNKISLNSYSRGNLIGKEDILRNSSKSMFNNKEVIGYNVFKDGMKINSTVVNSTVYNDNIDNSVNSCYSVEALFTEDRVSEKTSQVCIYGNCRKATDLVNPGVSMGNIELEWSEPENIVIENVEFKYDSGNENNNAIAFGQAFTFYALIQSTVIDLQSYDNLKLKSITAFILNNCEVSIVAIQDGKFILNEEQYDVEFGKYNTFEVPEGGIDIDVTKNLLIGLKIVTAAQVFTLGVDNGPGLSYRGDIISVDGKDLTTLNAMSNGQLNCNWNISADFEQVNAGTEYVVGYNVYRDGVNIDSVSDNKFGDDGAEVEVWYDYYVTALWNTGCESEASNVIKARAFPDKINNLDPNGFSLFPNPASDYVSINGNFDFLRIYNSAGLLVKELQYDSNKIDVKNLINGVYFVELYNADKMIVFRTKLIINK